MILSRTLAKRRIAAGERPGWFAAWGLVAADAVILFVALWVVFNWLMQVIYAAQPGPVLTGAILFIGIFVPMQVVLIISAIWAAKSRWQDVEGNPE